LYQILLFLDILRLPPRTTLFPYTTLFRSERVGSSEESLRFIPDADNIIPVLDDEWFEDDIVGKFNEFLRASFGEKNYHKNRAFRSEEHTSELQSRENLVCRLLLEKKKQNK